MTSRSFRAVSSMLIVLGLSLTLFRPALAGPILICKNYEIGAAKSLPWGGSDWRSVKSDYDINRLVEDTTALLTPDMPVVVRMETLRRAVIYAAWARIDREVNYAKRSDTAAQDLFSRLAGKSKESTIQSASKKPDPMKMFDAGFFLESWKQAYVEGSGKKPADFDGYLLVKQAIALRGNDPEMEFAAALITSVRQDKAAHRAHLQKAIAGAPEGSLLARNIINHFGRKGQTIADLRASLAKN
ncbi:MAG TPA: hypothetical protein VJ810_15725 [Blastocatellia bacterium]|nr:hypothetical protein [Blastocatellia bacterium]